MDAVEREEYEQEYKRKGFNIEKVPLSRIVWGFTEPRIYRNLTKIDESKLPELFKNEFWEYTIKDGRHRIYLAAQRTEGDPRKATIWAWVMNVRSGRHTEGYYVWQIVHQPYKSKKEKKRERIQQLFQRLKPTTLRRNCFSYLTAESRKALSWKARRLLRNIEFALQDLYAAEGNRIYDWIVIADIEDFALTHGDEEKTRKKQLERLKKYEILLSALVGRDIKNEKRTLSLIELFLEALEKELQESLPKAIREQLERVKYSLTGKEKNDYGMLEVLRHQLEIITSGKVPPSEELQKLRKIIEAEKTFYNASQWR